MISCPSDRRKQTARAVDSGGKAKAGSSLVWETTGSRGWKQCMGWMGRCPCVLGASRKQPSTPNPWNVSFLHGGLERVHENTDCYRRYTSLFLPPIEAVAARCVLAIFFVRFRSVHVSAFTVSLAIDVVSPAVPT